MQTILLSIDDLLADIEEQCKNAGPALCLAIDSDVQITESGVTPDAVTKTSEVDQLNSLEIT